MGLHCHYGSILMAGSGCLAHYHVADLVGGNFYIVLGCEVKQILTDFLLMLGGTRNVVDFIEDCKHVGRLKVFDCHSFLCFISQLKF